MNGQKRRSKKLVLDSGKVNHFLEVSLTSNHFNMNRFFTLKFNIDKLHFLEKKLIRNESQI